MACACKHKAGSTTPVKQIVKTSLLKNAAKPAVKKTMKKIVKRPI